MGFFEEDIHPEEQQEKQKQLIQLLRRAYQQEHVLPREEQEEAIMRVHARLLKEAEKQVQGVAVSGEQETGTRLSRLPGGLRRRGREQSLLNVVAAILIAGFLMGGSVLLFTQRMHAPASPVGKPTPTKPAQTPGPVHIQWNGLEMSMSIATPGPYFLGELIAVDLSLTNRSHPPVTLANTLVPCGDGSNLFTKQAGGTSPHYTPFSIPEPLVLSCPAMGPGRGVDFASGHTISARTYALLTSSGDVILTGEVAFDVPERITPTPLTGHWPRLSIRVTTDVPANRTLSLQQEGDNVVIHGPTHTQIFDQTYILCQDSDKHPWSSGTAHNYWESLSTNVLHRPDCPGAGLTHALWKYAVGVAGYEVAQGQQGIMEAEKLTGQ